jgi:glutathione peroxidase
MMRIQDFGPVVAAAGLVVSIGCGAGSSQSSASPEPRQTAVPTAATTGRIIDHTVSSLTGETVDLTSYRGRPMLIVNTASKCGYTPQYASLQELYERYGEGDLVVIGFPSNDFGNQEPGTAEEIGNFCRLNYGVTFPMMAKVHTKGPNQAPVYTALTTESGEEFRGEIRWNFTKFLVDQQGRVVARFESSVDPLDDQVTSAVDGLLADRSEGG